MNQPAKIATLALSLLAAAPALSVVAPATAAAAATAAPPAAKQLEGKLNVNTATATQWELLPGIGPATAARIVELRAKTPFKEPSHVMRVKGIGRKTFEKIQGYLTTSGETTLSVVGQGKASK